MISYWNSSCNNFPEYPSIKENLNVDVCIIGGGITGLSCAYYLTKFSDLKVCILEKDTICSHASSNNTGKLSSLHG